MSTGGGGGGGGETKMALLQAKQLRKLAEEDAVRLANRIDQLRKEELKAQKRIEETRKRAAEIEEMRERNEQHRVEKEKRILEQQEEVARQAELMAKQRKEHLEKKKKTKEVLEKQNREQVIQTKEARKTNERTKEAQKLEDRKRAYQMKERIREQQTLYREKAAHVKQKVLRETHEQYEERTKRELLLKTEKEKELAKLAKVEMDLIAALQKRQSEQEEALTELEGALSTSAASRGRGGEATTIIRRPLSVTGGRKGRTPKSSPKPKAPKVVMPKRTNPSTQTRSVVEPIGYTTRSFEAENGTNGGVLDSEEPTEAEIAKAFGIYDPDGKGAIATRDLASLLRRLGMELTQQQVAQCKAQLDPTSTGKVNFGEFLLWWRG